jgi:hypothetical protein
MRRTGRAGRPAAAVKKKPSGRKKAAVAARQPVAAKKSAAKKRAAAVKKSAAKKKYSAVKKSAAKKRGVAVKKSAVAKKRKYTIAKKKRGVAAKKSRPAVTAASYSPRAAVSKRVSAASVAKKRLGRPPKKAGSAEQKAKRKHPMYEQYMAELEKTMQRDNEKLADVYRKAAEKAKTNPTDIDKCGETLGKYLQDGGAVQVCGRNLRNLMRGR